MYFIKRRFLILGTVIISVYCILTFTHTNTEVKEKYGVLATTSESDVVQNPEEDEVILKPIIKNNPNLKVEEVSDGIDFSTSMAFLGPDDILVLEKNEGR
jgi:hypothetical protein